MLTQWFWSVYETAAKTGFKKIIYYSSFYFHAVRTELLSDILNYELN